MDRRKRGFKSLPPKGQEYTTKEDSAARNSLPLCPPLPAKRIAQKILFQEKSFAKAVFFNQPICLSSLYDSNKDLCYFDQIFTNKTIIGEGSFGIVFRVRSKEDGKVYAVKQQKSSHNLYYSYAEVQNYEKIGEHSNCVKFIMAWKEDKIVHIQMEYCRLSLAQYAASTHRIMESQLWEILYDMLKALDFLHSRNLIHLDVKPANIMMSGKGFYKLGDFGLLVDLNNHDGRKISTISDGDAKYLATEVLDGIYTYSCDIFGLGISLLELATNIELPEFGPLWHQIRKQCLPAAFYDGVTKTFALTIEKMMCKIHFRRPQASDLLKNAQLKKIQKQDLKTPRNVYCEELPDVPCNNNTINNIVDTPRRPMHEVRNSLRSDNLKESSKNSSLCRELQEKSSPGSVTRQGLIRVKLVF